MPFIADGAMIHWPPSGFAEISISGAI